jgi:nucleoside-diphosphate kinase
MMERTLSIIKPDAVVRGHSGEILKRFETAGLRIAACKLVRLSREHLRSNRY